jgi:phage tail sheath protein FI
MAFQLSPGVNVTEIDLTTVVPAVATSDGAIGGVFRWGPIGERVLVDSETILAKRFGKPTTFNAETYFTAASFLSYTNRLWVSRGANTSGATHNFTVTTNHSSSTQFRLDGDHTSVLMVDDYVYFSSNTEIFDYNVKRASIQSIDYNETNEGKTTIVLSESAMPFDADKTVDLYFAKPETAYSAVAVEEGGIVAHLDGQIVKNENDYIHVKDGNFDSDVVFVAKYPGELGNSLKVSICDNANSFSSNVDIVGGDNCTGTYSTTIGSNTFTLIITNNDGSPSVTKSNTFAAAIRSNFTVGDNIKVGNSSIGIQYMQITSISEVVTDSYDSRITFSFADPYRLHTAYSNTTAVSRHWEYFNSVSNSPGRSSYQTSYGSAVNDELHIVVSDEGGKFTGTPGTILEVFKSLSRSTDAKNSDGTINYYKEVINKNSAYIWFANDRSTATSAVAAELTTSTSSNPGTYSLMFGADGYDESNEESFPSVASAYDMFASSEDIDISLVLQGRPVNATQLANYIIDNITEIRKDCVAFVSPDKDLTLNSLGVEASNLVDWRNSLRSSSYAVIDSGYKYMYDKYNDVYRWIPLNGDVAGLCARTDQTNDAWWSPAGFNRGQIKNIVKLAYNPRKAERDLLYSNGINPVVAFPGQGTILYGDKTAQAKPSAFDRINVRRLFIVLEKAIATAAKYSLFEFNDAFTRSQFKNLVTPYLRNIQGRRGITDFLVVCDDTNNTPQIIDTNQFVGDIYIKPARSINFIQLNFVAVGTGVQFSEVVGKF